MAKRKPEEERKEKQLMTRVTASEAEAIEKQADEEGRTVANFLRVAALDRLNNK